MTKNVTVKVALADKVEDLRRRFPKVRPGEVLAVLKEAAAQRDRKSAGVLAGLLLSAPRPVPTGVLVDAATAMSAWRDDPTVQTLWQTAYERKGGHPAQRRQIVEGYVDGLLAAGAGDVALRVMGVEIARAPRGQRRSLLDRLVAAGRLAGDLEGVLQRLMALNDPDAAVLAAQLHGELGNDDAAVETLARAWKAFPGNRALQAAYTAMLVRLGRREVLQQVVEQVVRLQPADPMPWLAVLDSHVAVRDVQAARALIDDLSRRFARHDVLLEALIDREQRLGDDRKRLTRLYDLLLAAAPGEPAYVEAYAEWLLTLGDESRALAVLDRLRQADGEVPGLLRAAALLLAHNRLVAARKIVHRLVERAPDDPKVKRMLAQLDEKSGDRLDQAETGWAQLCRLPPKPTPNDRSRAAEARQALLNLVRRRGALTERLQVWQAQLVRDPGDLGLALLVLEALGGDESTPRADASTWRTLADKLVERFPHDPELLAAIAAGHAQRGLHTEALAVLEQLQRVEPESAEQPLQGLLEVALTHGDRPTAERIEALLLRGDGQRVPAGLLVRLGDVHLRHGDTTGAALHYRRAAANSPGDTRALSRLAALFRQAGAAEDEEAALRDIVQRATEAEELDTAGQRLLTLALARGRAGDLVRWLDVILPQHPRRDVLERFRFAAFDAWLRTRPLDLQLGDKGTPPTPGPVGDALASGDLALQVRALRQLAATGRPVPTALARQLLRSPNPVLRRDTALALAGTGTVMAAQLIRDVMADGADQDEDVARAHLVALATLPGTPGVESVLVPLHPRDPGLAMLAIGRVAGPTVLGLVLQHATPPSATGQRRETSIPAVLALGSLLGRHPDDAAVGPATEALVDLGHRLTSQRTDPLRQAAVLWALAASGRPAAREVLLRMALDAPQRTTRRLAVALLDGPRPTLPAPELEVGEVEQLREARHRLISRTLAPWLADEPAALARHLHNQADALDQAWQLRLQQRPDALPSLDEWCAAWGEGLPAQGKLADRCRQVAPAKP